MIFSGVSYVSLQPLLDKLSLQFGQEPGTGSALGESQHGDQAQKQRNSSFDDEQPPPSFEALPCAHELDPVCYQATESPGDGGRSVERCDSLPLAVARIRRRE